MKSSGISTQRTDHLTNLPGPSASKGKAGKRKAGKKFGRFTASKLTKAIKKTFGRSRSGLSKVNISKLPKSDIKERLSRPLTRSDSISSVRSAPDIGSRPSSYIDQSDRHSLNGFGNHQDFDTRIFDIGYSSRRDSISSDTESLNDDVDLGNISVDALDLELPDSEDIEREHFVKAFGAKFAEKHLERTIDNLIVDSITRENGHAVPESTEFLNNLITLSGKAVREFQSESPQVLESFVGAKITDADWKEKRDDFQQLLQGYTLGKIEDSLKNPNEKELLQDHLIVLEKHYGLTVDRVEPITAQKAELTSKEQVPATQQSEELAPPRPPKPAALQNSNIDDTKAPPLPPRQSNLPSAASLPNDEPLTIIDSEQSTTSADIIPDVSGTTTILDPESTIASAEPLTSEISETESVKAESINDSAVLSNDKEQQQLDAFIGTINAIDPDFSSAVESSVKEWVGNGHSVEKSINGLKSWVADNIDFEDYIWGKFDVNSGDEIYPDLESLNKSLILSGYSIDVIDRFNSIVDEFISGDTEKAQENLQSELDGLRESGSGIAGSLKFVVTEKKISETIKSITGIEVGTTINGGTAAASKEISTETASLISLLPNQQTATAEESPVADSPRGNLLKDIRARGQSGLKPVAETTKESLNDPQRKSAQRYQK